jgi:beta-N-acetylhexosaminidase
VMLDIAGTSLASTDRDRIRHPSVGGVILFARNYESPAQLSRLTAQISALRDPAVVIAVDHEGGRVQRFREGFTPIPAMATLGVLWDADPGAASIEAHRLGCCIANELAEHGVDFSFTPVLDLDYGTSEVIGTRALHRDPHVVATLARHLIDGLHASGMAAVGKHFPGHGHVAADSHIAIPVDPRPYEQIARDDLVPFEALGRSGGLDAIMPAHVIYSAVDASPAGFSSVWLRDVLRGRIGFDGMIFSDDLSMEGAKGMGDVVERADAACRAGCDMVLVCNDEDAADRLLAAWRPAHNDHLARRLETMRRRA